MNEQRLSNKNRSVTYTLMLRLWHSVLGQTRVERLAGGLAITLVRLSKKLKLKLLLADLLRENQAYTSPK